MQSRLTASVVSDVLDRPQTQPHVLAVSSGKGGVGKTTVVANLAIALSQAGKRVLVLDADLGLGNVDVLLGLVPTCTIEHVLRGTHSLRQVVLDGPCGIQVLPASSGVPQLTALTGPQQMLLLDQLEQVSESVDVLLIDTGAGISPNVTFFASSAHDTLVVVSPEPTSLTDAYALIKVLTRQYREQRFKVLVNMARSPREAMEVFKKLDTAADRFLHVALEYVGHIPDDDYVPLAVVRQKGLVEAFPESPASKALHRLAAHVMQWRAPLLPKSSVQLLWRRMMQSTVSR